jgi:putative Mg2+ transporter-C (MgtC) family protein
MLILAAAVTLGYFVIAIGFPVIFGLLPTSRWSVLPLSVFYEDGRGILREVLGACSSHGFTISKVYVGKSGSPAHGKARDDALSSHGRAPPIVNVSMSISGGRQVPQLLEEISAIPGVISVSGGRPEERE